MALKLSPEVIDLIARRFRVLSEPARLRILNELMHGERTVSDLVEVTGLSQANASKHLQLLRSTGFVGRRREGSFAFYRLADDSVRLLCQVMCARLEDQLEERAALLATGT